MILALVKCTFIKIITVFRVKLVLRRHWICIPKGVSSGDSTVFLFAIHVLAGKRSNEHGKFISRSRTFAISCCLAKCSSSSPSSGYIFLFFHYDIVLL